MRLEKGINLDAHEKDLNGFLKYAKNIVKKKGRTYFENELGFAITPLLRNGFKPIGFIEFEDSVVVFSTDSVNSEIGIFNGTNYIVKVSESVFSGANQLAFSLDHPITGEAQRNIKGEVIVAFRDSINTPKIINLDNIELPFQLKDIQAFPEGQIPNVGLGVSDTGGSLFSGAYYVAAKYIDADDAETQYLDISNIVYINTVINSGSIDTQEGSESGILTSKSLNINITNVDQTYKYIGLCIISIIKGVVKVVELNKITITGNTVTYTYTGSEQSSEISINNVLAIQPNYIAAESVGQNEGSLFWGGVKTAPELNLQRYVNRVQIDYTLKIVNPQQFNSSYKNSNFSSTYRSFMWDEVYAFYLVVRYKNGQRSQAYHIPGRPPIGNERDDFTTSSVGFSGKRFHFEDTTQNSGISNMGYYENENETYPETEEFNKIDGDSSSFDLRGQKVRHHKMPSLEKRGTYTANAISLLGIEVRNVQFPVEYEAFIDGWEIYYAVRDVRSASVLGHDLLMYNVEAGSLNNYQQIYNSKLVSVGGNFDTGLNRTTPKRNSYRSHIPDLLLDKNLLSIDSIKFVKKINYIYNRATDIFYSSYFANSASVGLRMNLTEAGRAIETNMPNANDNLPRRLTKKEFIDIGVVSDEIANTYLESYLLLEINPNEVPTDVNTVVIPQLPGSYDGASNATGGTTANIPFYLVAIGSFKKDMYNSYYNQQLAETVRDPVITDRFVFFGGDVFLNKNAFLQYGIHTGSSNEDDERFQGTLAFYAYWGFGTRNMGLRYTTTGDIYSYYIPKYDPFADTPRLGDAGNEFDRANDPVVNYNTDYNKINTFVKATIYNPFNTQINDFPYRIVRSQRTSAEEKAISWRKYLANDYYELRRDKGTIVNLISFGDILLIHTKYALFATRSKTRLSSDGIEINLGSTDIFELEPREIISTKKGYAGTQHKFSGYVCKYGYIFVNEQDKKIFRYTGGETAEEITEGIEQFLITYLNIKQDNPFHAYGINTIFDELNDRLLITFKGEQPFTISYSPSDKQVLSFHDYIADCNISIRNQLYSFKQGVLFKHESGRRGLFFDSLGIQKLYPSYVDVILAIPEQGMLQSFGIISEIWSDVREYDEPLTHVTVRTDVHCDYRKQLVDMINTRQVKGIWNFNQIRDRLKRDASSRFSRFISNPLNNYTIDESTLLDSERNRRYTYDWFIVRLEYDNEANKEARFLQLIPNFIQSVR